MIDKSTEQQKDLLMIFIKSKTGVDVTQDSLVFDDLGIDGLDAHTFMEDFSKNFNVDLSDFNIGDYCFSEYEIGNVFLSFYRSIFHRKKLNKASFKVSHLMDVIKAGRWIEPS